MEVGHTQAYNKLGWKFGKSTNAEYICIHFKIEGMEEEDLIKEIIEMGASEQGQQLADESFDCLKNGEPTPIQKYLMEQEEKNSSDPVLSKIKFLKRKELLRVVNGSYIAKRFFGKSESWFSQKLNNNIKNGKPCKFTDEELETLRNALHTIAIELQDLADELR